MTAGEVGVLLAEVKRCADNGDDEGAHVAEDAMMRAVLRSIAAGNPDARSMAQACIESFQLDFGRWCA